MATRFVSDIVSCSLWIDQQDERKNKSLPCVEKETRFLHTVHNTGVYRTIWIDHRKWKTHRLTRGFFTSAPDIIDCERVDCQRNHKCTCAVWRVWCLCSESKKRQRDGMLAERRESLYTQPNSWPPTELSVNESTGKWRVGKRAAAAEGRVRWVRMGGSGAAECDGDDGHWRQTSVHLLLLSSSFFFWF